MSTADRTFQIHARILSMLNRDPHGMLSTSVYRLSKALGVGEIELLKALAVIRARKQLAVDLGVLKKGRQALVIWRPAPLDRQKPPRELADVLCEALNPPPPIDVPSTASED